MAKNRLSAEIAKSLKKRNHVRQTCKLALRKKQSKLVSKLGKPAKMLGCSNIELYSTSDGEDDLATSLGGASVPLSLFQHRMYDIKSGGQPQEIDSNILPPEESRGHLFPTKREKSSSKKERKSQLAFYFQCVSLINIRKAKIMEQGDFKEYYPLGKNYLEEKKLKLLKIRERRYLYNMHYRFLDKKLKNNKENGTKKLYEAAAIDPDVPPSKHSYSHTDLNTMLQRRFEISREERNKNDIFFRKIFSQLDKEEAEIIASIEAETISEDEQQSPTKKENKE